MSEIVSAAGIMLGLTSFFGVVLAFAHLKLRVDEDPRIGVVEDMLPATNCGACGEAGCRAFAEALVAHRTAPSRCTVSSPEGIESIAQYLGVAAGEAERRVARLHCAGGKSSVRKLADYAGLTSCRGAFVVNGGGRACTWGCLGLGDCDQACTFDAIHMSHEELPVVEVDACTACGDCVEACPVNLFTIEPVSHHVVVQCSSPQVGDAAREACLVACDACGRCALDAPEGVTEMVGGLPVLRQPHKAPRESTFRCPTGAIQWIEEQQFEDLMAASKSRIHLEQVS